MYPTVVDPRCSEPRLNVAPYPFYISTECHEIWLHYLILSELKSEALYSYVHSHESRCFSHSSLRANIDFTFLTYPHQEDYLARRE
jgi:hypothetical protein